MVSTPEILQAVFTTVLVVTLLLMIVNTAFLAYKPILYHLKEIYFINARGFNRSWYLIIAGMSIFSVGRIFDLAGTIGVIGSTEAILVLDLAFASLVMGGMLEPVLIFGKYTRKIGASNNEVETAIRNDLRQAVVDLDESKGLDIDLTVAENAHSGRDTLGQNVSLNHYRAITMGITKYMEHRFGEMGDAMLHSLGRQTGRRAASAFAAENPGDSIGQFCRALQGAGVGIPQVVENNDQRLKVTVAECVTCAGMAHMKEPSCHYIAGLMEGLMEANWGKRAVARETKCAGMGAPECEFMVEQLLVDSPGIKSFS